MVKKGNKKKQQKKAGMVVVRSRGLADAGPAAAYRRALVDPCYAALPSSPYGGAAGSAMVRSHSQVATTGAYYLVFYHPVFGAFTCADTTGATALSLVPNANAGPVISSGAARGIAGCLAVSFTGAESARAGMVRCGLVPGTAVYAYMAAASGGGGTTLTLGPLGSALAHVERMPVDKCEVNWMPGDGDEVFVTPLGYVAANSSMYASLFAKTNFCCALIQASVSGAVDISTTAIYEYTTGSSAGSAPGGGNLTWDVPTNTMPAFNYKAVLSDLARKDSSWFLNTFRKVANFVGGAASSYVTAGLPGALGYLAQEVAGRAPKTKQMRAMAR